MPYYEKAEDWLHQSALLLQARPSTTRISTRYHLKPGRRTPKSKTQKDEKDAASQTQTLQQQPTPPPEQSQSQQQEGGQDKKPPRGHLVLKTFEPHSGISLKYKTSKAAEVSRLIQMLGTLGKRMAGVPVQQEDVPMSEAPAVGGEGEGAAGSGIGSGVQTPTPVGLAAGGKETVPQGLVQGGVAGGGAGGGGGKGKKKKGKR